MRWWAALAAASALSCARDLSVPAPSARPVLTSFSPTAAFANAILTIRGKNFDPVAVNNVVQFTARSARAFAFDAAGNLQVYVPEGTANDIDGRISVSNAAGASNSSSVEFTYNGRGHPFLGTEVGTTRFLHRPPGIGVIAGEPVLASTAAFAVMGASGFFAALGGEPSAFAGLADESAVFAAAGGKIAGLPAAGRPVLDLGSIAVRFLAASPGSSHLIAAGADPIGVIHLVGISPSDLSKTAERTVAGAVLGLAALDDGRAVLSSASGLTLLDLTTGASQQLAGALSGAVAAMPGAIAAAFADGTVRMLTLGATPAFGASMPTGSLEPFATLVASGALIAGAKISERVVRVLRADTGAIVAEHAFAGSPRALFFRPAQILVADDAANAVDGMDPATGNLVARWTFPLDLGSSLGCGQGSAVEQDPRPQHYRYRFLSVARRTNQLIGIDYNSLVPQPPVVLATGSTPARGIAMPGPAGVFIVHQTEIGRLSDDDTEQILTSALPGAQCLLFPDSTGAAVVVLTSQAASVLRGSSVTGSVALPGPVVSGGVRADGKIVISFGDAGQPGASPRARLYTVDAIEHGGAPDAQFGGAVQYQGFIGAFQTAWGPMMFFTWDSAAQAAGSFAVLLDDALVARPAITTGIGERGVVRTTPDGYFFVWQREGSRDDVLRVASAYDLGTVYPYAAYRVDGLPSAPAFDATGEYMYVPVPDHDEIQTFQ